jgi:crotonobetainyl-CoA:carnitine CoA-transferase CaiB-like acyl-CoA transferase
MVELFDDPQVRAMGWLRTVKHPELGEFETMGPPFEMSGHEMPADRPAPPLGADGETVLDEAGLAADEIAAALGRERK